MADLDHDPGTLDRKLRRALEPGDRANRRLVRKALAAGGGARASRLPGRWSLPRLAAAGALALLLFLAVWPRSPDVPRSPPEAAGPAAADPLEISNEHGFVTVTAPAGSKMIILPGETS